MTQQEERFVQQMGADVVAELAPKEAPYYNRLSSRYFDPSGTTGTRGGFPPHLMTPSVLAALSVVAPLVLAWIGGLAADIAKDGIKEYVLGKLKKEKAAFTADQYQQIDRALMSALEAEHLPPEQVLAISQGIKKKLFGEEEEG